MGADEESGWRASVDAEEWRRQGHGAGCARFIEEARAIDADHGPRLAVRSGLRKNLAAVLQKSGSARRCVCQGVVQANAPRHGTCLPLPWAAGAEGAPVVARPGSRSGS